MTFAKLLFLCVLVSGFAVAQQVSHPVMVSRDDAFSTPRPYKVAADTIDILAVMVQFQQDNSPLTSGDGRFDLTLGTDPIIDAPPHNRQYFLDHCTFLANYFRRSSKDKVIIRTTVLDSIITLSGTMQDYSPPRTGSTVAVGNLARDTWQKVDSAGLVPDFSRYECFVVLHAGTGRDIDLVSLLGYDPTPYDIPSLYIGLNGFRQYYGSGYAGIPVNGGAFHITNSIVLPESENRNLPTVTGTALLELSINGLLCASVGNFLGLPDLFDTNTGRSGIGRFGLMDGQSIFSFKGVFPPEPSAWEKYWLGWIEPIALQGGESTVSLPAVSLPQADTVYRVPISAQEYFLVENRNRDAGRNGQRITSTFRGGSRIQTFLRDTAGFNAFDLDSLAGVVTDVEDLDWSLPGGVNSDGVFFDGGILIWHIDEAVIAQGLQANGVNGNPLRRAVDLEEADGSQDIGQSYEFLSPGSGSEEGTALDFWYPGNGSPVNRNIFSPTSYPDSRSNSGANSHITISDFGPVVANISGAPRMTAKVKVGDDVVKLLQGFPKSVGQQLTVPSLTTGQLTGDNDPELIVTTNGQRALRPDRPGAIVPVQGGQIYAWKSNGGPALPVASSNGLFAQLSPSPGRFVGPVAINDLNNDGISEVIATADSTGISLQTLVAYSPVPRPLDSLAQILFGVAATSFRFLTSPTVGDSMIAVGGRDGLVYFFRFDGTSIDGIRWVPDSIVSGVSLYSGSNRFIIAGNTGTVGIATRTTAGGVASPEPARNFGKLIAGPSVAGVFGSNSEVKIAFATRDGFVYLVNSLLEPLPGFPINTGGAIAQPPALADVDGDGVRDVVVFSGSRICVYNLAGASLDNFPKTVSQSIPITSHPVVADLDGDMKVEVVAVTSDGLVAAYDRNGTMAKGFPLQAGAGNQSVAAFTMSVPQLSITEIGLAVASSDDGSVTAWKTGSVGGNAAPNFPWPQYQKDARHSGLALEPLTRSPLSSDFFPKSRAYNWPNPVYDGKTFIRYFVKDNAAVNIKVFDLAGDLVTTIPNPPGVGGVDNEVEWNVAGVQSGIYFAHIEANGVSGSGVAVVKIAVVK